MHNRIVAFLHSYRTELATLAISVFAVGAIIYFSEPYLDFVSSFLIRHQVSSVDAVMGQELNYLSHQREDIIASKIFDDALKAGDASRILAEAQFQAKKRGLDFIVVTDKDGFVLARSHVPGQVGDNVFQTTSQGELIAQGETVTAVVHGVTVPLASISGSLILENGHAIGSIILGYVVNDAYAERLQDKYLDSDSHVLFYTSRRGIVGSSVGDAQELRLLSLFFSPGSDLITHQELQVGEEMKINGRYYYARNILFPGIDSSPGGAVILLAVSHTLRCAISAALAVLTFLFLYGYLSRRRAFRREKHYPYLIAALALLVFVAAYFTNLARLDRDAIELKDFPYPIYNSTLRFVPDSGIIHPSVKTNVAVTLLTGGEAINDVRATIQYDPAELKVIDVLTTGSVCGPAGFLEKTIDGKAGLVKINCVTENVNPGFYQPEGTVAELVVVPLAEGGASLKFVDKTQVLANDGLETNVLRAMTDAYYQVTRQGLTSVNIKDSIPVFSPTHPNSNRWYQRKDVQLSWPVLAGGNYYYALNQIPDFKPQDRDSSTTSNYLDLPIGGDGAYYFHLRGRSADGQWGPVSHFKVMVDATPPLAPVIKSSAVKTGSGELVRFNFSAKDDVSGVQKNFYVRFDSGTWFPTLPQLYVPFFNGERHTVSLRVFDNAGNFTDASVVVAAP